MQRLFLFLLCVNIVLYLNVPEVRTLPNDLLDNFFNKQEMTEYLNDGTGNLQLSDDVQKAIPTEVRRGLITEITTFITDGLAFAWDLIKLLINVSTISFALFTLMHPVISILIAVPISGLWVVLIAQFLRGVVIQ